MTVATGSHLLAADILNLVSTQTVTATGATTARTLPNYFGDVIDVKNFGAKMDGVTNDTAAFQAARNAAVANPASTGIVFVPSGGYDVSPGPSGSGNVLWQLSGNCYGTGTTPVANFGTDAFETILSGGQKYIGRTNSTANGPGVLRLDNTITHTGGIVGYTMSTLQLNTNVPSEGAALNNYVWGIISEMTSSSLGPSQNVGINSTVIRPTNALADGLGPRGEIWGANFNVTDQTNQSSSGLSGSMVSVEVDLNANGTDAIHARRAIQIALQQGIPNASGGLACQVGYGVIIGANDAYTSVGVGFSLYAPFYNAGFDASFGTSLSSAPAFRMAAGQLFDVSGAGTHTLSYSASNVLAYAVSGTTEFSVSDTGAVVANGSITSDGGIIVATSPTRAFQFTGSPIVGFDATQGTPVNNAIRLAANQTIAMEATNTRTFRWDGTHGYFAFADSPNDIFTIDSSGNTIASGAVTASSYAVTGSTSPVFNATGSAGTVALAMNAGQEIQFSGTHVLFVNSGSLAYQVSSTNVLTLDGSGNATFTGYCKAINFEVGSNQVVGARITGWGTSSNGTRGAVNGSTATLAQVSAALAQLIIDLTTHGLIGT